MLGSNTPLFAQTFEDALELYENEQYEKAASAFQNLNSPEGVLFTGKSYYSLGEYLKAKSLLNSLPDNASPQVINEARFTLALVEFQLSQFGLALNRLYRLKEITPRTSLVNQSRSLYNDILDYLTLAQRRQAFQSVRFPEIQSDLIRSAFGKVDYKTARMLLDELKRSASPSGEISFEPLEQMLSDSLNYTYRDSYARRLSAPRGMVYDIGATLPRSIAGSPEFSASQGLYQGYLLAAEEFNQRNADKKAFIRYQNTGADMDSAGYAMNRLAWSSNVDLVLGPLYSEPAVQVAALAEQYHIPVMAPLANADSLNIDNPYVFQANPTFSIHGKRMARYAVNNLNMDTLAVFAERNSLGAASAYAFRTEAERLGAHIEHFMIEDLEERGYDISDFTARFAPDTVQASSAGFNKTASTSSGRLHQPLDGIYAPFTGQAAPTLIELLMVDLQVMNSRLTVLGSQEWGATEIPEEHLQNRSIYFSESFHIDSQNERVRQFREDFSQRFGTEASRYALIGYDSADFILRTLERVGNPALLKEAIKTEPLYEGLISNIHFEGTHVNQEVKIFTITPQGIQPVAN
ncbi:ABC transporter substrate-binding protein [Halalkalibaculum sp. DA3122]|uniref:ABC transporter substrate-binding protein n=1 Tax=Halalkalibaculum sp. DA3122 TaxID=3373607 RepID=UPI003754ACB5